MEIYTNSQITKFIQIAETVLNTTESVPMQSQDFLVRIISYC
jgi:hypothetical protein